MPLTISGAGWPEDQRQTRTSARDCLVRRDVVSQVGHTRGARGATLKTLVYEDVVELDGGFGA